MRNKNQLVSLCYSVMAAACLLYGTSAFATIVDDLQPGTWLEIPNSKLETLNPCPGDNCNYSAPIQGFFGIMDAWNGGTYDTNQNRLIVWGGGHQSYFGNDMYAFDLDTLSWSQLMAPSDYEVTSAQESAGQFPDGRPVSRHTYNSLVFIESQNAFLAAGASVLSPSGQSGDAKFWKLDFDNANLEWSRGQDGDSNGSLGSGYAAYNPATQTVFYHREIGGRMYEYNPSTNTHRFLTQQPLQFYATPAIDTSRNKMLVLGGGTSQAMVWDLNTDIPTYTNLLNVSAFTGSAGNELANDGQFGLDYDSQNDQYVAWRGGSTVYYINPVTFQVTKSTLPGSGPGAASTNGTYGRFQYAPSVGGFVVVNATNRNVHVFKTAAGGTNPGPIVSFSANDETIDEGASVTLSWSATNATGCVASGDWSGSLAVSGSQTIPNISADQTFVITCSGDGGDTTQNVSITVNAVAPPPPGADDWASRSGAAGVLSAYRFDSVDEINNWKQLDGSAGNVAWETGNKTSGNGALRINVLNSDGSNSGSWRRWLADDQREFTEGDEFYVSYRQYFPSYFSTHVFNGGGWKQSIISRNAAEMNGVSQDCSTGECGSNQLNELVLVNNRYRGLIQGYNRNSNGAYPGWDVGTSNACSNTDFVYQNAVDRGPQNVGSACENDRARYGGLFSYGSRTGSPDPLTGAFTYGEDQWVTFKLWVKLGSQGTSTANSQVKIWAAREGENWDLLIDRDNLDLGAGPAHNTLWLLPYDTGKQANPSRQDTYTLYDEVIVSLNDIVVPGGDALPPPPAEPAVTLSASSTFVVTGDNVNLTWSSTNANSCQASGDWSGSLGVSGQQTLSNLQQNSAFTITCTGDGGSANSTVQVDVQAPAAAPVIELESSSTSVVTGTTISLTWSSTNASSCQASGDWSGSVGVSGQQAFTNLLEISTYTLTCTGAGGTTSETVQVNVTAPTDPPVLEFNMSPLALRPLGTVVLIWNSPNSNSCTASGSWSGLRNIAGIQIVGPVATSETYTISCTNNIGTIEDTITVSYADSDSDGMADVWEMVMFGSLQNTGNNDSDSDGLIDQEEYEHGTDPGRDDTDGDGQSDGDEVAGGSDPRDSGSISGNTSPNQPVVVDNRKADLVSFELEAVSGYIDPDGNPLNYSQWQIALDQGYTSLVFDRSVVGSTSMMVPMGVLQPSETYYLRTRHFDSSNTPSAWSITATLVGDPQFPNDADNNHVNDTYQVPGNPDTNNNGVADQNEGICNLYDAEGGNVIGLTSNLGTIQCYTSVANSVAANGDLASGSEVPLGMFSFRIENLTVDPSNPVSVDVTFYLPESYATDSGWQKFDEATGEFSDYSSNVTFSGNTATVRLVDGGVGDQDGTVNGIIVDPSGPVVAEAAVTPPVIPPVTPPVTPPVAPPTTSPAPSSSGGGGLGVLGLALLLGVGRRRVLVRAGEQRQ